MSRGALYSSLQRIVMFKPESDDRTEEAECIRELENKVLSIFHKNYEKFDIEIKCSYSIIDDLQVAS